MQNGKVSNQCSEKSKSKVTFCPAKTHILNVTQHIKLNEEKKNYINSPDIIYNPNPNFVLFCRIIIEIASPR
ncbi:hypothetical protein, partial [Aquimarina sp. AD10]|uniref:hypothetical protein n=1 Tax=Aquimarina sp. AD10 TaxID=1714849 RepID=UPI001F2133CB